MDNKDQITVTSPLLPDLDEFNALLKEIWESKWITNNGSFHRQLEKELAAYLKSALYQSFYERNAAFDYGSASVADNGRSDYDPV